MLAEAELPASRDILVIAYRHHTGLVDAIERRQGERAESLAREHARLALANLEIVVEHRDVLDRLPGASLITLTDEPTPIRRPSPSPSPPDAPGSSGGAAPRPGPAPRGRPTRTA